MADAPSPQSALALDTMTLIQVVPTLLKPSNWLLNRFFPRVVMSDTEKVAIDVEIGKRRIAPLVSPLVAGKLVEARKVQTREIAPAYIKDKRAPDLRRPIRRAIGERIGGGGLTPVQREMANLTYEMEDQVQMIDRRLEWMAASALQTGTVTLSGEGFETVVVDFGRDSRLTVTLTGGNVWGDASHIDVNGMDTKVVSDINAYCTLVLQISGAVITDLVFTPKSWGLFLNGRDLNGAKVLPKQNSNGNVINPATAPVQGAVYQGSWGGKDLWLYNDWYVDPADETEKPMLTDGNLLFVSSQVDGSQAFGVILDPKVNYASLPYAPKTWVEEDPAQRIILMQSAPIVIPGRPNASMCLRVA
jgi:hypothetical protein